MEPQDNINQGAGLQEVQTQDLMEYQLAHDREQHLECELFAYREDNNEAAFAVAAAEKIYAHESLTFNNTVACEVIFKWKAGLKDDMDARSYVYVLSNGCRKCSDDSDGYYWGYTPGVFIHLFLYIDDMVFSCGCKVEIWATKGLLDKAKGNVLSMEIVKNQSGYTLRVSPSRFYNRKLEYQMVCTILDIASADVGSKEENMAKGTLNRVKIRAKDSSRYWYWCLGKRWFPVRGSSTSRVKMSHENVRYSLRRIPWGGIEQVRFLEFLASMEGVALVEMRDTWVWSFEGSGEFSVASVRKLIVKRWLPKVSIKTR
nr:zinc finger, CCHC-type [Tanacetum cinerariifolium]